jgi:hypothetical protein
MPAQTIDEVIARLEVIVDDAALSGSTLGFFALLYLRVTRAVRDGIQLGRFENGPRMEKLDVLFANRYLEAFDQYSSGQPCTYSWKRAFDNAGNDRLIVLQHLFLGMNAHINLDLGISAAETAPGEAIAELERDFTEINQLLNEQVDAVQEKLGALSPLIFLLDWIGRRGDEKFAEFSLKMARNHAWSVAQRLAPLAPEAKKTEIEILDEKVALLSQLITHPGRLAEAVIRIIGWLETRDVRRALERLR